MWGKGRALPQLESSVKFAQTVQHPREGRSQVARVQSVPGRESGWQGVAEGPAAQPGAWSRPVCREEALHKALWGAL